MWSKVRLEIFLKNKDPKIHYFALKLYIRASKLYSSGGQGVRGPGPLLYPVVQWGLFISATACLLAGTMKRILKGYPRDVTAQFLHDNKRWRR